jgi:hypothetical protein
LNADNGLHGTGAVWELTASPAGALEPGAATKKRRIELRITNVPEGWRDAPIWMGGFGNMEAKVLGRVAPK